MNAPCLFATPASISAIRSRVGQYAWYREAYRRIKQAVDTMLAEGVCVPDQSGFVFYDCCERDNQTLAFDPYRPFVFCCPQCGMRYDDMPHRRAWILRYHSWLSQMSVLAGIVYQVEGDERYARFLRGVLMDYARVYPGFENNDCELGPTKMAQSTYIESVFIMYFAAGYDMVRMDACFSPEDHRLLEYGFFRPSVTTILDYDEGRNNRQAFNNAGILAVGYLLGDAGLVDYALHGPHGFVYHMEHSVLSDGMWYEGDNYHFATVPSLLNIAEMCRNNGHDVYTAVYDGPGGPHTLESLLQAPLRSLQPDLTFPSRKDSRYANYFGQRWYVGMYELAWARYRNPDFAAILERVYAHAAQYAGSLNSAAGIMEVLPAEIAARDNLDWRGFLAAEPQLASEGSREAGSVVLAGTGLAVIKRDGGTYFSVDYGDYGGGHGHPDRLAIHYFARGQRWLSDFGTGSYYFDHLRYYRSTLGHNTVEIDGQAHLQKDGVCTHFYDDGRVSLTHCVVRGIAAGVDFARTDILVGDVLIDLVRLHAEKPHQYAYILHPIARLSHGYGEAAAVLEGDGYDFASAVRRLDGHGGWAFAALKDGASLGIAALEGPSAYTASAYGPPNDIPDLYPVLMLRQQAGDAHYAVCMAPDVQPAIAAEKPGCYAVDVPDVGRIQVAEIHPQGSLPGWLVTLPGGEVYAFGNVPAAGDGAVRLENRAPVPDTPPPEEALEACLFPARCGLTLQLNNRGSALLEAVVTGLPDRIAIPSGGQALLDVPKESMSLQPSAASFETVVTTGQRSLPLSFHKSLVRIQPVPDTLPVDDWPFTPNLLIDSPAQIRRNEKRYGGMEDLSVRAVLAANSQGLILRAVIRDDRVRFTGGKFPYDNDCVQVYFDPRACACMDDFTAQGGIVGLLVLPPQNDEATRVLPIGQTRLAPDHAAASVAASGDGYTLLLTLSWEALGGRPSPGSLLGFDLIVNDRDSGTRRDQQGIWSGCLPGERAYLREDRHAPGRFGLALMPADI